METKEVIRKRMLSLRESIPREQRDKANARLKELLLESQEFSEAQQLLLYISVGSEADTRQLLAACKESKKDVFCPRILAKGKMEFFRIIGIEDLKVTQFHLLEPIGGEPYSEAAVPERTLMVMPGVAFDRNKNRLGYGGGYYDRYLGGMPWLKTIMLAYEEQLYDGIIPADSTDISPDKILTPIGIYR